MKYCIHCGKENDDNAKFCKYCGANSEMNIQNRGSNVVKKRIREFIHGLLLY